jgi:hypothetical protein
MRHCDDQCPFLEFAEEGEDCQILQLKQKRKSGEWYVETEDGDRLYPLCEDKVVRVSKKVRKML